MLKLEHVYKKYGNKMILNDINYEFKTKYLYMIKGENGSGKSTLIKILAKTIYKTNGKIDADLSFSYLPDKYNLPKLIKVSNYLYSYSNNKELVKYYMYRYLIPDKLIMNLSKGNYQKIGIIMMLMNEMDVYLLDEPFDGLDIDIKEVLKDDIKRLVNNNKIVILVSHINIDIKDINIKRLEMVNGCLYEKE